MALDPRYVASADLQEYLVDKDSGLPLVGGKVYFYQDNSRTTPKAVYELSGSFPNYSFSPLPNPITLSAVGTIQDGSGNDIIPYYLPLLIDSDGNITDQTDLYYVVVQSATGVNQFTRQAWPPNSETGGGATPGTEQSLINYIPNGQFLIHNNPNTTTGNITATSTVIAPGGWTFEIASSVSSTNSVTFPAVGGPTQDPQQSPLFQCNLQCTAANPSETYKALRVKFNDVNKFANNLPYTFGFSGASLAGDITVTVNVYKFFAGGTAPITTQEATFTLTSVQSFFATSFNFGDNAGTTVGSSGQSYVAIDISFNTALTFDVELTDFVLIPGVEGALQDFPAQTNADMMTRSVMGWTNLPDYNGQDLYLPAVLTPGGMAFDHSIIGKIEQSVGGVARPTDALNANPAPLGNDMPCNVGDSYISSQYSTLGIPFSRLGNFLITRSPVANTPMFGTGTNFGTIYAQTGNTSSMRLTVNSNGTGVTGATAVTTPGAWTFTTIPIYNGVSTGSASLEYVAYNNVANTVLAVANFTTANGPNAAAGKGPSCPFTVTTLDNQIGLTAQQFYAFTVLCTAGSTLVTGTTAYYITFSSSTATDINYRMWFQTGTETAPSGGSGIQLIEVNVQPSDTAQDIANIVRETISALQSTNIIVNGAPSEGAYFNFQTNPASTLNYFTWYSYLTNSTAPIVGGRTGIKVLLPTSPTNAQIVTATLTAMNAYQYAPPPFNQGMFLRGVDFNGVYDLDVAQRWSSVSGLSGANYGTFEFQQLLNHFHVDGTLGGAGVIAGGGAIGSTNTNYTGGSETRPVNAYINYVIKY